jgi:hypothetical protein
MGTPKGEGRSRGARRGGDRRPEASSPTGSRAEPSASTQVLRTQGAAGAGRPGRGEASRAVEEPAVVDAPSAALEAGSVGAAVESEGVVSKSSVEIAERVLQTLDTSQPALAGADLAGSANSNHRADIAHVPPAGPAQHVEDEPAGASRRSSREHTARLEAASVLDAPASMHESVSPPSKGSWALRAWVAAMLAIIGTAGFVAMRERGAHSNGVPAETKLVESSAAKVKAQEPAPVPPPAAAPSSGTSPVTAAVLTPPASSAPPERAAVLAPTALEAGGAVLEQGQSPHPTEASPSPDSTPEEDARVRRAARRAATATAAGTPERAAAGAVTSVSGTPEASGASRDARREVLESAGEALESLRAPNPAVRDPGVTPHAIPQIPGNPYESEDNGPAAP